MWCSLLHHLLKLCNLAPCCPGDRQRSAPQLGAGMAGEQITRLKCERHRVKLDW